MNKSPQFHILNTLSQALSEIFEKDKNADRMIEKYMRVNQKWNAFERKFFAESVYEIVRHKRLLEFLAERENNFSLIGAFMIKNDYKLLPRVEFADLDVSRIKTRMKLSKSPAIEFSLPDWLFELGEKEFSKDWPELMKALNRPPDVYLRVNTLKTNSEKLQKDLKLEEIKVEPVKVQNTILSDCLILKERKNIFASASFKSGSFEMQDAGSQMISPLLEVLPGQSVVDACAGAGGKTLHLASLMQNKGKIVAMDIHEWKLKDLSLRASRAGAGIIETKLITSPKVIKQLENSFDRVLLDAPCSGLGVLRRNPDSKWKMNIDDIAGLVTLQREILTKYSEMCKSGGLMVYATCSMLKRENEEQVTWFLESKAGKNWTLKKDLRIWPHKLGFDGFYAAVFKKN